MLSGMQTTTEDGGVDPSWPPIERLVSFSDAVIAIALTLLILPLVEDATTEHLTSVDALVDASGRQFFVFLLSFVVICRFWLIHHGLFREVALFNPLLFWLNALWLLSIVVLPFSTEIIGSSDSSRALVTGIYIGTMLATSSTSVAMLWVVERTPGLQRPGRAPLSLVSGVVTMATMALILVVAVAVPAIGQWALLLLVTSEPISRVYTRRRRTAG
jgi:uncharacterized membrane protein